MKIRILGSGTSSGVPRIGGDWGACDPAEPRNRRTRVSAIVEHEGTRILIHDLTPAMRALYAGLDIWVVDALRHAPHPSHPTVAQTLGWIGELRPGRAALIHMDQSLDYARLAAALPVGVEPGFDGLELLC